MSHTQSHFGGFAFVLVVFVLLVIIGAVALGSGYGY
ncbi:sporulation protein YjcZ [Evansella sp. AB-P1]|nr:sporulation protein YjcZ [Evansella sp. AB-P1]MDG5789100.1 sporulation protein YjcZ [Evansella sp. AB-P1]